MFQVREILKPLLDLVYPRICNECNQKISEDDNYFCVSCYSKLKYLSIADDRENIRRKSNFHNSIDEVYSLFYFEPHTVSQKIIHMIKYEGMKNLGIQMGKALGEKLTQAGVKADKIIPVPLHISRKRERGFNQSEVIASGVSQIIGAPMVSGILKRARSTKSQTRLNREERLLNVHDAFELKIKPDLAGKSIIILDDVITSGATLLSCARLLKKLNAEKVIALSLAYVDDIHDILQINT